MMVPLGRPAVDVTTTASARVSYIFVEKKAGQALVGQRQAIWEFISENYRILDSDQDGVWFQLQDGERGSSPGS